MPRLVRRPPAPSVLPAFLPALAAAVAVCWAMMAAGLPGQAGGGAAWAQSAQRIAAVVNDDVVSVFDVNRRLDMVIATSRLPDTPETRNRVLGQVMQQLVDERLKMQEANRLRITITPGDIENGKRQVERNNGMPPGGLDQALRGMGISPEVFEQQLKADVAWVKVVQTALRRQIQVEPEEVDAVLDQLRRNQGKPQRLLAEIHLAVNAPEDDDRVRQFAGRLVEQIAEGANFPALARQFSSAPTAAVGGDLGWVPEGQLDPEVEDVLARLGKGQLSLPVRTPQGWALYLMRDRRVVEPPPPDQLAVTLSQLYMPTSGGAAVAADKRAELIQTLPGSSPSCGDIDRLADEMKLPNSGVMGSIKPADLPPAVRDAVLAAEVGKLVGPVTVGNAEVLLMVCDRQDPSGLPSREQVELRISGDKLERVAQRHLRDLRRRAVIDIRL